MRVVVTGGAGFVGSHLCKRLLREGRHVTAVDNLYTGRRENVANLLEKKEFSLVEHDVIKPLPASLGKTERVYHLACPASPPHYQRDPIYTTRTAFLGTLNALEYAARCGARHLQASTSEVYGDPEVHPQVETYRGAVNPIGPRACYDEGKRVGETLCADFARTGKADVRIARIFNTYGPNMDPKDGRVVSNFIMQALLGEPLTIYGEGQQTRSFCYVDDLVDGLVRLMESEKDPGPTNLGNPVEFTIAELADQVLEIVGGKSRIEKHPLPEDDPKMRRPDISRAREALAFDPKTPLAEGLRSTVDYFRELAR